MLLPFRQTYSAVETSSLADLWDFGWFVSSDTPVQVTPKSPPFYMTAVSASLIAETHWPALTLFHLWHQRKLANVTWIWCWRLCGITPVIPRSWVYDKCVIYTFWYVCLQVYAHTHTHTHTLARTFHRIFVPTEELKSCTRDVARNQHLIVARYWTVKEFLHFAEISSLKRG